MVTACGTSVPFRTSPTSSREFRVHPTTALTREEPMDTQLKMLGKDAESVNDPIKHLKPSIDPSTLFHRQLLDGAFWQKIPAYRLAVQATFLRFNQQDHKTIT